MELKLPCSVGDAFDRISILQVKCENLTDEAKLAAVRAELNAVLESTHKAGLSCVVCDEHFASLLEVNRALWDIENGVRKALRLKDDKLFLVHAKHVAPMNDRRASIKLAINRKYDSALVEVKNHEGVQ